MFGSRRLEDGKSWLARSLFFTVCSTILSSGGCIRVARRNDPGWVQGEGQVDMRVEWRFSEEPPLHPAPLCQKSRRCVSNYSSNVCCLCLPTLNRFLCLWYNEKHWTITVLSSQISVTKYSVLMMNYFNCFGWHLQYVRVAKSQTQKQQHTFGQWLLYKDHLQDRNLCVTVSPFTALSELMRNMRGTEGFGYS